MSLLFRILHAVHARGTHHKLTLDAVARLDVADAEQWQRMFLKHWAVLLQGSKAPDAEFKDFTNHVLHPRDDWWGGAPQKARSWYGHLVEALDAHDWPTAAYAAGVMSHYLTDPVQPFHTAQSEAENAIHRAFEWSVSNAYGELQGMAMMAERRRIEAGTTPNWLEVLVAEAASEANGHYEKLIAHFDIHRAVVDPPTGLDIIAKRIVAQLLELARGLVATVIARAIAEAKASPPEVTLGLETFLATIKIPAARWTRRIENADERRLVERIYDELKATGTVEKNLPEDERVVRDAFAAEVLAKRKPVEAAAVIPYAPRVAVETTVARRERQRRAASRPIPAPAARVAAPALDRSLPEALVVEPPRPAPAAADQAAPVEAVERRRSMAEPVGVRDATPPTVVAPVETPVEPLAPARIPVEQRQIAPMAAALRVVASAAMEPLRTGPRIYLTGAHDIVDAPSIGPKMAERLIPLGLVTVDDLLACRPEMVAEALDTRGIDAGAVRDWQDQARLVCTVAGLRGTHAQLLVGAGYRTVDAIVDAEPDVLCARVLGFAATADGHRVLRNGDPPDIERIKGWLETARAVRAA